MDRVSEAQVFDCCACRSFATKVAAHLDAGAAARGGVDGVTAVARDVWWNQTSVAGWLEAFGAHPRIGDAAALHAKLGGFADMSRSEQAAASDAPEAIYQELANWNRRYEAKFGHVFLIYAAGKGATEILAALQRRHNATPYEELGQAAAEQMKITEGRLRLLMGAAEEVLPQPPSGARPPVTSHVLDVALGRPAEGVLVTLQRAPDGAAGCGLSGAAVWDTLSAARTNGDGRVPELLSPLDFLPAGRYRVVFGTDAYMAGCRATHPGVWPPDSFYPTASVVFQERQHFHIPLTWSPFGYSTYRGS